MVSTFDLLLSLLSEGTQAELLRAVHAAKTQLRQWTRTGHASDREKLPRMEGPIRAKALKRLAHKTQVRQLGGRQFRLYRGVSQSELDACLRGKRLIYKDKTSWTPHLDQADGFAIEYKAKGHAGKTVAAWIPEKAIHTIPVEYRVSAFTLEHEVIVDAGSFGLFAVTDPKPAG